MKFILGSFLVLLICLYCFFLQPIIQNDKIPEYIKIARNIRHETLVSIEEKLGFKAVGTGESFGGKINGLFICFDCPGEIDLETARLLAASVTEFFRDNINSNTAARPYLNSYPFNTEGIRLQFCFADPTKHFMTRGCTSVFIKDGDFSLLVDDENSKTILHIKESYAETMQKLKEQGIEKFDNFELVKAKLRECNHNQWY